VARSASYSHKVPAMAVLAACSRTLTIRAARSSNVRPVGVQQEAGQRGLLHWPIVVHAGAGVSSDAGAQLPKTVNVSFPVSELAVTPGDIAGSGSPVVELGSYQVQIGTPASRSADFTIHR
jgi:hypothetical protein